jgi:hypothetical protein
MNAARSITSSFVIFSLGLGVLHSEEKKTESPKLEQLSEDLYRLGEVILDKKKREASIPAIVNMREGLIEFLVVHEHGKLHESLFSTKAIPLDLSLALTILNFKQSKELYYIPREPGIPSDKLYQVPEETRLASRLQIFIEQEIDGVKKRTPANEWIFNKETSQHMKPTHWVFGGSDFFKGKYIPDSTGDIAAVFVTDNASINYSGDENTNDMIWEPFTDRIPEKETKVTLIFAPHLAP